MRPTKDEWALQLALVTAQRSTCCRRQVGCVLLDVDGHVLSTGYNGVAAGLPHCNDPEVISYDPSTGEAEGTYFPHACLGSSAPSGTNLDGCEAIHAEQNALLQCRDVREINRCYVTTAPCVTCTKLLMNTGCRAIYFLKPYPHAAAETLWTRAGRKWVQYNLP